MSEDTQYEDEDFSGGRPFEDEQSGCTFRDCTFVQADLGGLLFVDCVFEDCDLSRATLVDTRLQNVRFKDCRLSGVDFSACSAFAFDVGFSDCTLDYACFAAVDLRGASLVDSSLVGTDFTGTNLSGASLLGCDLKDAIFEQTNLERADLRDCGSLAINPQTNRLSKARISRESLPGLLLDLELEIE